MTLRQPRRRSLALVALLAGLALTLLGHVASADAAGTWWHLDSPVAPTILPLAGEGQINAYATDLGYEEVLANAEHPVKLTDTVPAGFTIVSAGVRGYSSANTGRTTGVKIPCETVGQVVSCTVSRSLAPSEGLEVIIPLTTDFTTAPTGAATNIVSIEGGASKTPPDSVEEPIKVGGATTSFGIEKFTIVPEDEAGGVETQAGKHPFQLTTTLNVDQTRELLGQPPTEEEVSPAPLRNLDFVLPPGLLGNVTVVPQCSSLEFNSIEEKDINACKPETAIGVARIKLDEPNNYHGPTTASVPVFNLVPAAGEPARFGIEIDKVPVVLDTRVRTGSNYAVEVEAQNTTEVAALLDTQVTFWGVPGDPRHDSSRGWECIDNGIWVQGFEPERKCNHLNDTEPKPFLSLPTSCASTPVANVDGESWPIGSARAVDRASERYEFGSPLTGCGLLSFQPSLAVEPTTNLASSPTGLNVHISLPQKTTLAAGEPAEADLSDATLTLPVGIEASPAAADGLLACSGGEFGFNGGSESATSLAENDHFEPGPIACPEAAKIGTVKIKTPLLAHELTGGVYLASQDTDPFQSPLVLYLYAEDPISGVRVKLAGEVRIDQGTGQLTTVFSGNPPVPFEDLTVSLFSGPRATQSTPALCGSYTTNATFVPSSGESAATPSSSFSIDSSDEGGPCPPNPLPFAPAFQSGSLDSQAGAFSDFTLSIEHPDSNQALTGVEAHLPAGLAAMLSSVTPCQEPAVGAPWSCGAESLIGQSSTASGLGGDPYTLAGQVYLTSGYDGAPFGLLVATEAKAGPFNLGMVYVRSRINVDESTAAVTVTTDAGPHGDALPTMLKGVPVQLKALNVTINRPNFQFNPTNCGEKAVSATLTGAGGATAGVSSRFEVEHCEALPFKPTLTTATESAFSKADGASLSVEVDSSFGQANIAKTRLVFPKSLPSRLSTIQQACPDSAFEENPANCSAHYAGSLIGMGIAHTPVLREPLMGPAYLVSHGGAAFPDVEFVLQGEGITLVLDGQTNIHDGITTSTFNAVPDAPVSSFDVILPRGPHSIFTAYLPGHTNLCGSNLTVPTTLTGQNGVVIEQDTKLAVSGCVVAKARKLTRAQQLAAALKACRRKHGKKRLSCERQARRKYGPKAKAKKVARKK